MKFGLAKDERLKRKSTFERIFEEGRRLKTGRVTLFYLGGKNARPPLLRPVSSRRQLSGIESNEFFGKRTGLTRSFSENSIWFFMLTVC